MGLPRLDFRVPESTWFKSALAERIASLPSLTSPGALAWPYKIAVVAVMALVACGTLVTFGTAGAETASSTEAAPLPGAGEANPSVQGQVLPSSPAILNPSDLLSTLNVADYGPDDTTQISLADDSDSDSDSDAAAEIRKKLTKRTPTPSRTPTPRASGPTPTHTTTSPRPTPTQQVEGPKHKQWRAAMASYESKHDAWEDDKSDYDACLRKQGNLDLGNLDTCEKPGAEPQSPGSEPSFTS